VTDAAGVPDGWMGLDVGPKSNDIFRSTVLEAKTILWNGYVKAILSTGQIIDRVPVLLVFLSSKNLRRVPRCSSRPLKKPFKREPQ
jgi:hypothetical protein